MYFEKFVLSVIHDGHPVKESGSRGNRQVAVPFGSEYKLRLKNKNDRSCTANIAIDGTPVSNFGDVIINAGGSIDLERFITSSMKSGKRFKFVDLNHVDVDDPTKSENGIVRVEFRLAKHENGIKITPNSWEPVKPPWTWAHSDWNFTCVDPVGSKDIYKKFSKMKSSNNHDGTIMYCASNFCGTEAGATIEGNHSGQSFTYSNLEVESHATVLELKIVGIRKGMIQGSGRYCTSCGHRVKKQDKYCSGCGRRI